MTETTSIKPLIELLDEKEVCRVLKVSQSKLRQDRCRGIGIPFVAIGRSIRYRCPDIENYLSQNLRTNTLTAAVRKLKRA